MVGSHCLLLAVAFIGSASSAIASRILGEDLLETGFTFIPISNAEDDAIEAEVAAALEEDSHVTGESCELVKLEEDLISMNGYFHRPMVRCSSLSCIIVQLSSGTSTSIGNILLGCPYGMWMSMRPGDGHQPGIRTSIWDMHVPD